MSDQKLEPFTEELDYDTANPDIAGEHQDTSLAGQLGGGPEHADEPESPEGRAGMDE
jgi:hypothetical protein